MKTLSEKIVRGRRQVVLALDEGETVIGVRPHAHYRLGAQHGDIVPAHALVETEEVYWDHISQKWEAA